MPSRSAWAGCQALLFLSLICAAANGLTLKELKGPNSGAWISGGDVIPKRVSNSQQILAALKQLEAASNANLLLLSKTEEIILDETIVLGASIYSNFIFFVLEGNAKGKRVTLRCGKAKTALRIKAETVFGNVDITGCTESAIVVDIKRPECTQVYLDKAGLYNCDVPLTLIHMAVHGNSGKQGGGMYIQRGPVFMDSFEFTNNTAEEGGALYINQRACFIGGQGGSDDLARNKFTGNSATRGGAMFFNDAACAWQVGVVDEEGVSIAPSQKLINNLTADGKFVNTMLFMRFEGNQAELGGAMYVVQQFMESEDLALYKLFFYDNTATKRGGAVYLEDIRAVIAADAVFKGNRAGLAGGAVWASSTIYGTLTMQGATLRDNKVDLALLPRIATIERDAGNGGAVYAAGSINYNSTLKAKYINNTAPMNGGALHCSWCIYILFESSYMINNTACSGGGMALDSVAGPSNISSIHFLGNRAECLPAAVAKYSRAATGQVDVSSESALICGSGGGGGACVRSLSLLKLNGNNFTSNRATSGGALYIAQDACASIPAPCNVTVTSQRFKQNFADSAGGAVYLTSFSRIMFSLPQLHFGMANNITSVFKEVDAASSKNSNYSQGCRYAVSMHQVIFGTRAGSQGLERCCNGSGINIFEDNMVSSKGYGPTLASMLTCIVPYTAEARTDEPFTLTARVFDAIGQRINVAGNQALSFLASSNDPDVLLRPPVAFNFTNAAVELQGMTVSMRKPNSSKRRIDILITASPWPADVPQRMTRGTVDIVGCRPGSILSNNSCQPCGAKEYTFDEFGNNGRCWVCPDGATCEQSFLVPQDGFWHASPLSNNTHQCPLKRACALLPPKERVEELRKFHASNLATQLSSTRNFTMDATFVMIYTKLECGIGYAGNVCGNCAERYGRRSGSRCARCTSRATSWLAYIGIQVLLMAIVSVLVVTRLNRPVTWSVTTKGPPVELLKSSSFHASPSGTMDVSDQSMFSKLRQAWRGLGDEASNFLAGLVEVLVVYTQLLGLLRTTEIEWPKGLDDLVKVLGLPLASVTWLSPDCLLPAGTSNLGIKRVLITTLTPGASTLVLVAIWGALTAWRQRQQGHTRAKLLHSTIVVAVSCATFYYPSISNAAMSIFSCHKLDDEDAVYGNLPSVAAAPMGWWKQDYSVQCFRGSHLAFALAYGVPMLVLVVLGIPAYITCFLWRHHRRGDFEHNDAFKERFRFMFADFRDGYWFWFSFRFWLLLVMSAAAQVPSFYGAARQVTTIGLSIGAFLWIHLLACPYRSRTVNGIYSAILYAILATILLAVTYLGPSTAEAAETTMALVITINVAVTAVQLLIILLGLFGSGHRIRWVTSSISRVLHLQYCLQMKSKPPETGVQAEA